MDNAHYPVDTVWRELFSRVFSGLGRMVCLANCRDPKPGGYFHNTLTHRLGVREADRAMRVTHELIWKDWLNGSLEQQQADFFCIYAI